MLLIILAMFAQAFLYIMLGSRTFWNYETYMCMCCHIDWWFKLFVKTERVGASCSVVASAGTMTTQCAIAEWFLILKQCWIKLNNLTSRTMLRWTFNAIVSSVEPSLLCQAMSQSLGYLCHARTISNLVFAACATKHHRKKVASFYIAQDPKVGWIDSQHVSVPFCILQ